MADNNKKTNIIYFTIMLIVLILIDLFIYSKFIYNEKIDYIDDFSESDYTLEEEKIDSQDGKIEIVQTVTSTKNNLEAITIEFDKDFRTYNKSQIEIKIIEYETGKIIGRYTDIYNSVSMNYIDHKFSFKKQPKSLGKKYNIIINYEKSIDDNAVFYSENEIDSGTLNINGKKYNGHISYKLHYDSKYANTIFNISITFVNILAIATIYTALFKKSNFSKLFLILISILGITYLIVIPMYRGHDESAHFFRAYEISKGIFNTKIENDKSITEVPKAFVKAMEEFDEENKVNVIDKGFYSSLGNSLNIRIDSKTEKVDGSYMAVYSFVPYIPQAIAIKIASIFTNRVVTIFYFARMANLIVSIIILYISFKILPYGKKLLFLICMIPTVLFQISTMSPDALTFTSCVLFVSYVLRLINDKKYITNKSILILSLIGSVIGLSKIAYIPLVFITLLIPKNLFKNKNTRKKLLIYVILIPVILNLIWLVIAGKHLALIDHNKSDVQKSFILTNPFKYVRISIYTVFSEIGGLLRQLFGSYLGHIDYVQVGDINVYIFMILFILVVLFDESLKEKIDRFGKIIISSIILIIVALIFTSIYMQWSGYKWYFINGLQGRYFIEILLPLGILLGQNNLVKIGQINLTKTIICGTMLANILTIMSAVVAYI